MRAGTSTQNLARGAGVLALAAAAVILFLLLTGGGSDRHQLTATVDEAASLISGQMVEGGGGDGEIGQIEAVEVVDGGQAAKITLGIDDDAWPLAEGSTFDVRWGGTAAVHNRYVQVTPPTEAGADLADGAEIPAEDFTIPVEVDTLLATFTEERRGELKDFMGEAGESVGSSGDELEETIEEAPPAVTAAAGLMEDITADTAVLDAALVRADRVVDSIDRSEPDLETLLEGTATTLSAIADEQDDLGTMLTRMPGALRQTQTTLTQAETTLGKASVLASKISPGVQELREIASPLDGVLSTLERVAPDGTATLSTVRKATPSVNALLEHATGLSPQLASLGRGANENLRCIRPWTPEIVGLLTTWADFMSYADANDKILRAQVQSYLPAQFNSLPTSPAEAAELYPGLVYGFPRPPGFNAGQPWFQPECGAGPEALDPAQDQEAQVNGTPAPATDGGGGG